MIYHFVKITQKARFHTSCEDIN